MSFSSDIFEFKNNFFRHNAIIAYQKALQYQNFSKQEKRLHDWNLRKKLLEHAYNNCAFYKKFYDEKKFNPRQLIKEEDWGKVPVLEKLMIRQHQEELIDKEISKKKLIVSTTGGSTGTPLKVYKSTDVYYEILGWRAFSWYNIHPAANVGIIHRNVPQTLMSKFINRFLWWPTQRIYCNATAMTNNDVKRFIGGLKKQKTIWLVGYCGALEYIADYIIDNSIQIDTIQLIWSTSSPLTNSVRQKLKLAFHAEIMDQYGCCEMSNIAVQKCGEPYLTVNADYVHVDIIDENNHILNNEHKYGDILITDLKSAAYPLIKYRLGDKSRIVKTREESTDGFPKLEFVQGRISDALVLPDKSIVDGSYLTTICDNYTDLVDYYQIYQNKDYSIKIKIKLKPKRTQEDKQIKEILHLLEAKTKKQVPVILEFADEIKSNGGKRQFIISEISLSKTNLNESSPYNTKLNFK